MLWDPGLQPERTALAWRRTGLAAATCAVVVLRSAIMRGAWVAILVGAATLVLVALVLRASRHGYTRATRQLGRGGPPDALADPRGATAAVVLLAVAAVLTALGR